MPGFTHQLDEQISALLFSNFHLENKTISIFLPIESKKEINTYLILEKGLSIQSKFTISKSDFTTMQMEHFLYEGPSQIEINRFGIPEPSFGKVVAEKDIDIVLVPLMAFDQDGYRVGYGKGFYDRFLSKCSPNCLFIGLSYFDEVETIDDRDAYDVKIHFCVTPTSVHKF